MQPTSPYAPRVISVSENSWVRNVLDSVTKQKAHLRQGPSKSPIDLWSNSGSFTTGI